MKLDELNINLIKDLFTNAVYHRGSRYYQEGRVRDLVYDPPRKTWSAKVRGTKSYTVKIEEAGNVLSYECNCPAFRQYDEPCKHIAAVLLKINEGENSKKIPQNRTGSLRKQEESLGQRKQDWERQSRKRQAVYVKQLTSDFIQAVSNLAPINEESKNKSPLLVEWMMTIKRSNHFSQQILSIEMKVGLKRTYVVKNLRDFINAIEKKLQYPFSGNYTYDPVEQVFKEHDQKIITLLQELIQTEKAIDHFQSTPYQYLNRKDERTISIPPIIADDLLEKVRDCTFRFEYDGQKYNHLVIYENQLPLSMQLEKGKLTDHIQLDVADFLNYTYLDLYGYLIQENFLYKVRFDQQRFLTQLKRLIDKTGSAFIPIASDQLDIFLSQAVPVISKIAELEITDEVSSKIVNLPLQAKVFADIDHEGLHVNLEFHYGEFMINPFKPAAKKNNEPIIMRDTEKEFMIMDLVESSSLKMTEKGL